MRISHTRPSEGGQKINLYTCSHNNTHNIICCSELKKLLGHPTILYHCMIMHAEGKQIELTVECTVVNKFQ